MKEENALNPVGNVIETIRAHIYDISGKKVMLDRDLAELYHVETSQLNRQVSRNAERFPPDFMFKISVEELQGNLICQNGTSSYGGNRNPRPSSPPAVSPYPFAAGIGAARAKRVKRIARRRPQGAGPPKIKIKLSP